MNVPAIISLFRVAREPRLCLPHHTIPTFAQLPIPLSGAFKTYQAGEKQVQIKAIVLDKDNCFATPNQDHIHPAYHDKFQSLLKAYPAGNILIVSNSSGLASADPTGAKAAALERSTGVPVLRHAKPKPACGDEILAHFGDRVDSPAQIAVVGDRLFTDIVMANRMGAYAVWIREGVVPDQGIVTRLEYGVSNWLLQRGYMARRP